MCISVCLLSNSCGNQSKKEANSLCEKYNSQAPFKVDGNTTLSKVVCTDAFFTFHYILSGYEFNDGLNYILETSMIEQLKKLVNVSSEFSALKKANLSVGYVYEDDKGNVLFAILFTLVEKAYVYDKHLSNIIFTKLSKSNKLHSNSQNKGIDKYNWKNEKHKVFMNIPSSFLVIENDKSNMLLNAVDTQNSRSLEFIYSEDDSFKTITHEEYAGLISKEALLSVLATQYMDVAFNIWEPAFHTKTGEVVHAVYTGKIIDNGIRQTVIMFQFIRNNKLYTIKGSCMPNDLREFHLVMREAIDKLFFL